MPPYALIADVHLHTWSMFATTLPSGVNSRLQGLLNEIVRAARTLRSHGGKKLIVAGDLFHVRGKVAPSVLNPALDIFRAITFSGVEVIIIPGNHDLEGKDSERLGSAVTALEGVGCKVLHAPELIDDTMLVPWVEDPEDLMNRLVETAANLGAQVGRTDLILHAPINGVIKGIPDTGLDPEALGKLGFRRVFAGHYHAHVEFPNTGVYSIGALAHHSFNDVGARAGFVLVGENLPEVQHFESELPKFVDVSSETAAANIPALVRGNFARVKVTTSKVSDIEAMRDYLTKAGALGVTVINVKPAVEVREGQVSTISAGASLEVSVQDYAGTVALPEGVDRAAVQTMCQTVLAESEFA